MFADLAFFSFIALTDPTAHRAYNEWHQLDHLPENLALPGVAHGQRWARRGECGQAGRTSPEFAGVDYAAMYWFRSPLEESLREWDRLGEASFQWGRGPIFPGVARPFLGFFRPVAGIAAGRIGVSSEVLPFRPNRGVHLTMSRYRDHHGLATHERYRWENSELLPALTGLPGVAGAWTFSFSHAQRHSSLSFGNDQSPEPGSLRVRLVYLDGDPIETSVAIAHTTAEVDRSATALARDAEEVLFSSPLSTIIPWQDW
ncbi:hypothetical protein [Salinibacterium sp. ZJ70]|uniref:hypothetical protein n=1 Tax=Salinibacterium sp. ZJ70 TaxID=2708084 RepID=UPI001423E5EC|nr:hypothetical protein [Salinibacterium sp. ZJ70]